MAGERVLPVEKEIPEFYVGQSNESYNSYVTNKIEEIDFDDYLELYDSGYRKNLDGSEEILRDGKYAIKHANGKVEGDISLFPITFSDYVDDGSFIQRYSNGDVYVEYPDGRTGFMKSDGSIIGDCSLFGITPINSTVGDTTSAFMQYLKPSISTNRDDAASGDFIDGQLINDQAFLDNDLIFDENVNGTYLISVINSSGIKVPMGWTDSEAYNSYKNAINSSSGSDVYGNYEVQMNVDGYDLKVYENGEIFVFDGNGNLCKRVNSNVVHSHSSRDGSMTNVYADDSVVTKDSSGKIISISVSGLKDSTNNTGSSTNKDGGSSDNVDSDNGGNEQSENNDVDLEDGSSSGGAGMETKDYIETSTADGFTTRIYNDGSKRIMKDGKEVYIQHDGKVVGDLNLIGVKQYSDNSDMIIQEHPDGSYYIEHKDGRSAFKNSVGAIIGSKELFLGNLSAKDDGYISDSSGIKFKVLDDGSTHMISNDGREAVKYSNGKVTGNVELFGVKKYNDTADITILEHPDGSIYIEHKDGRSAFKDSNGKFVGDLELMGVKQYSDSSNTVIQERADGSYYIEDSHGNTAVKGVDGNVTGNENLFNDYSTRYSGTGMHPAAGTFNVTTGNQKYDLSEDEMVELAAIIYGEAVEGSPDDALAVASVMANRVESDVKWGGQSEGLIGIAHAAGQFEAYLKNVSKYRNFKSSYANGTLNEGMQICFKAVQDLMNGVRNNDYYYFTGNGDYNKYRYK